ncbi:MAG TPA: hypothetical protein VGG35_08090 [Streptosporangiaceae bacterium]
MPAPGHLGLETARSVRGTRRERRRRLRDRPAIRIIAVLLAVTVAWLGWSLGHALTNPGGGTVAQRVAEWARDHYLGPLVTFGEWVTYQPPKVGGTPSFSLAGPGLHASSRPGASAGTGQRPRPGSGAGIAPPVPLRSPAGRPLRGEGQWRVLYRVHHDAAIYATYLRPDKVHTSYVAGLVSMDPRLLRFRLRPGTEDPGPGSYGGAQPVIAPGARRGLAATFNSGFKIAQSGGGFYLGGTYRGALRAGIASVVYYRDGTLAIGAWGRGGLRMTPGVAGVRQNLRPIVEHGQIPASVGQNVESSWGATLGGGYYVWRSGLGVTRDGRIIFAYGPALDVRTLAGLLRRAGCVTAMQLDINPEWTNFMYYRPGRHPGDPAPAALLPGQMEPAGRYYSDSGRDFTAVYAR